MIFIDTSALYAVLDRTDRNHAHAGRCWTQMLDAGHPLFTSNYVVLETCALAQNRLGIDAVRILQADILPVIEVRWIDASIHAMAMASLLAARRRKLSLVDCSSFVMMRQTGARTAFAYDQHFAEEGFACYAG
jgi:predicted nucleic acid-binding protein